MGAKLYFDVAAGQWVLTSRADKKMVTVNDAGRIKMGNQPGEALGYMTDGYGVSVADSYSASATNRIYALEINADTGSRDLTGDTNVGAIKARMVIGTTQTNMGASALIGTLDVGTVNLVSNYNGLCGVVDFYGNCTLGGSQSHVCGLAAVVWNEATTTSTGAGNSIAGVDIVQNSGSPTLTGGINPGIYIRAGTSSRWQHGIYIEPTHIKSSAFRAGNQEGEETAYIIDGYGVNLAVRYSATDYEFGTSYRIYALEINADTGGVDMTGDVNAGAIKGRMVVGTTQTNMGACGVVGTLDIGSGKNIISNYQGVCGVVDFYGNTTVGGAGSHVAALVGVVWNEGTTTINSDATSNVSGLDLVQNSGTPTCTSGINPAINIRATATSRWQYGIYMQDVTRAFYGTATVTGTTAMDVFSLVVTDSTTTASGTSRGLRVQYTSSGVKTGGNVYAADVKLTVSAGTMTYAWGQQISMAFSGTYVVDSVYGMFIYQGALGSGATVANLYGLAIGVNNTNAASYAAAIRLYCHGGTANSAIHLANSGGAPFTHLVDFEGQVAPVSSETGTTFAGDGVKIAIAVGATTFYLRACTAFS